MWFRPCRHAIRSSHAIPQSVAKKAAELVTPVMCFLTRPVPLKHFQLHLKICLQIKNYWPSFVNSSPIYVYFKGWSSLRSSSHGFASFSQILWALTVASETLSVTNAQSSLSCLAGPAVCYLSTLILASWANSFCSWNPISLVTSVCHSKDKHPYGYPLP